MALIPLAAADAGETRFHQFTAKFKSTPDQAAVVAAGWLGGKGTEWFAAGGFQPDGTVVAAGVALGPTLDAGAPVAVIGTDAPAPPEPKPQQATKDGKPKVDQDGKPVYEPPKWTHENATAFIVRYAPDLQQIKSVSRFPWKSGGVTGAAVDAEGCIYLTGPASATIAAVGGDCKDLPVQDSGQKDAPCNHVYLAKLSPDAAKVLWLRHMTGPSCAPEITLDKQGKLLFQGPDLRRFDANGTQESVTVVPGGLGKRVAVNPVDRTYARGGEHHWPTGREPYRDPILNIYKPDGTWLHELYNWDGPYVGLDSLRLVSDTAIRGVRYDDEGNLICHAWSDGGNSVMYRQPFDIYAAHNCQGLGFSGWGVGGAMSFAYVVKIETKGYKVIGGTLWCCFLMDKNRPNSIFVDGMGFASDGSVCLMGRSASGLIQTGNAIGLTRENTVKEANAQDPLVTGGPYVAVLNKDYSSLRFCSAMPACGKVDVNGEPWGVGRGAVNGQPKLMFLTGAVEQEDVYGRVYRAPSVKPLQKSYGGGFSDAYVVVLDLAQK
ncbi:MAG: hypothetical protein NTW87_32315 [Planctomycetota bacterium]|nr:hypothetical protein [Planctomycetota bacterium]